MIKDTYDFETKRMYRHEFEKFITRHYPDAGRRWGLTFAGLIGHEGLDAILLKKLGLNPRKIYGIEHRPEIAERIRGLNLGINVYEGEAKDFFLKTPEKFDIINLDFQSQFGEEEEGTIRNIFFYERLKPRAIVATNFFGSRENLDKQDSYRRQVATFHTGVGLLNYLKISTKLNSKERQQYLESIGMGMADENVFSELE